MAVPFPPTGVPAMPHPDNAPRFDDLDRLSIGEIADMPPALLLDLQTTALAETARRLGIGHDAVIAVGDGANDLPLLLRAGLGVAFRAHPRVRERAPVSIVHGDLRAILYLQGYPRAAHRSG